ncbi:unnamed protein product [Amoebophrya sp. A120]|nr:unnamed protein product [Amoebophrya sp. A120]|eukprot:GSA120T00020134001.1
MAGDDVIMAAASSSRSKNGAGTTTSHHASSSSTANLNKATADKGKLNIESEDVIRLMLQFCRDNDLPRTLMTLQEEAKVPLNTVDSLESLLDDVNHGRWDDVMRACSYLALPMDVKVDLFEHVCLEFLENLEFDTAQVLMEHTQPLKVLKSDHPDRFQKLAQMIRRQQVPENAGAILYGNGRSKKDRRGELAQALTEYVHVCPPNRLLALIGQAVRWQKHVGVLKDGEDIDLFRGIDKNLMKMGQAGSVVETDTYPRHRAKQIKLAEIPSICAYSHDGQFLAVGAEDGMVELYDSRSGKSRQDLPYQNPQDPHYIATQHPIQALGFSNSNTLLAVGDTKGALYVFAVESGQLKQKIQGHEGPILTLCWNYQDSQVVTGSADSTARLHGLNTGKTLKEYRGHTSYVQTVLYSYDQSKVITGSADAYVKVFDAKTCQVLQSFHPPTPSYLGAHGNLLSINQVVLSPDAMDKSNPTIYVSTECNQIFKMNLQGQVLKTFTSGKLDSRADFTCIQVSKSGKYLYGISKDHCLYIFDSVETKLVHIVPELADKDIVGVDVHPLRSGYLAVWGHDKAVGLLRP